MKGRHAALAAAVVALAAVVFARTPVGAPLDLLAFASSDVDDASSAQVTIVTKSEITYEGQLVGRTKTVIRGDQSLEIPLPPPPSPAASSAPRPPPAPKTAPARPIRCDMVVEKLKQAVAKVEPAIAVLASTKSPIVLSSCIYEGWPEPLKECIVMASAEEIAAHRCDALVSDELAQKLIDRLAPGQHVSPRDFLQR